MRLAADVDSPGPEGLDLLSSSLLGPVVAILSREPTTNPKKQLHREVLDDDA